MKVYVSCKNQATKRKIEKHFRKENITDFELYFKNDRDGDSKIKDYDVFIAETDAISNDVERHILFDFQKERFYFGLDQEGIVFKDEKRDEIKKEQKLEDFLLYIQRRLSVLQGSRDFSVSFIGTGLVSRRSLEECCRNDNISTINVYSKNPDKREVVIRTIEDTIAYEKKKKKNPNFTIANSQEIDGILDSDVMIIATKGDYHLDILEEYAQRELIKNTFPSLESENFREEEKTFLIKEMKRFKEKYDLFKNKGVSRTVLLDEDIPVMKDIAEKIRGYEGLVIMVSNPVEPFCALLHEYSGIDKSRIVGFSSVSTFRLKSELRRAYQNIGNDEYLPLEDINTISLGHHGPNSFPYFSRSTMRGKDISDVFRGHETELEKVKDMVEWRAHEYARWMGGTDLDPSRALTELMSYLGWGNEFSSISFDMDIDGRREVLVPVSCYDKNEKVWLLYPTKFDGLRPEPKHDLELDAFEKEMMKKSSDFVKEKTDYVMNR